MYKQLHIRPIITKYVLWVLQVYQKVFKHNGFKISSHNENNKNICHTLNKWNFSTLI
jgi:hypothetical protein